MNPADLRFENSPGPITENVVRWIASNMEATVDGAIRAMPDAMILAFNQLADEVAYRNTTDDDFEPNRDAQVAQLATYMHLRLLHDGGGRTVSGTLAEIQDGLDALSVITVLELGARVGMYADFYPRDPFSGDGITMQLSEPFASAATEAEMHAEYERRFRSWVMTFDPWGHS